MLVNKKQEWIDYQKLNAPEPKTYPRTKSTGLKTKFFALVLLAAIMAMGVAIQSEAIIRAGYTIVKTKEQIAKLEKENDMLRLDIAKLKSRQRIQSIATNNLGMVVPQNIYCATNSAPVPVREQDQERVTGAVAGLLRVGKAEASMARR